MQEVVHILVNNRGMPVPSTPTASSLACMLDKARGSACLQLACMLDKARGSACLQRMPHRIAIKFQQLAKMSFVAVLGIAVQMAIFMFSRSRGTRLQCLRCFESHYQMPHWKLNPISCQRICKTYKQSTQSCFDLLWLQTGTKIMRLMMVSTL